MKNPRTTEMAACPCGSGGSYDSCCGRLHAGMPAVSAEQLMRSRYSAYVLADEPYLLATWHDTSRPLELGLRDETPAAQWLGLQIASQRQLDGTHAEVEFVARYKINGRAFRLHETSRFVLEQGKWFYVDGTIHA